MEIAQLIIVGKIALSMFLSGLIGLEREIKDHPAGLRTNMLVGGASTLFVILGELTTMHVLSTVDPSAVQTDPVRIIQAVVVGISFLVAGTIFQRRGEGEVKGLTTAASILIISGVGVCVAIDQYILAIGTTLLTLLVLHLVQFMEHRLNI